MNFKNFNQKKLFIAITSIAVLFLSTSCGKIWDPADARKVSPNSKERVKKNLEEGKGISLKGLAGSGRGMGSSSGMGAGSFKGTTQSQISLGAMGG